MEDCFINFDCDRVASLMEEGIFVNLSNIPRELDIIRVIKCSKTEIWEVNFLTSCFPIIRKTIKRIKNLIETY